MDSNFSIMKPIFLKELQAHLANIAIPAKLGTANEKRVEDGTLFLNIDIIFPGARSNLGAFASDKTFRSGVSAGITKLADGKGYFGITDYTKYKNISGKENLTFDIRRTSYTNGFNSALNYLIDLYNNNLKDVLLGKFWEDIPFDWGDYK